MKALVLDEIGILRVHDKPMPQAGSGEMLLRVIAVGICGSDLHGYTGENGRRHPGQVMGHEAVAVVEVADPESRPDIRVGENVTFNPVVGCGECDWCSAGDTQRCAGKYVIGVAPEIDAAMAEYIAVPSSSVVSVDKLVTPELGALVEPLAVGEHAVAGVDPTPTDSVWVIGAGPIGQAIVLALVRRGVQRVTVTDPSEARRALLRGFIDDVLEPEHADSHFDVVGAPTIVFDAVGASVTAAAALSSSAAAATIVLVGMNAPQLQIPAYAVSVDERTLKGSFCYSQGDFLRVAQWIQETDVDLIALVDGRVGLDDAAAAFADLASGQSAASKILVVPTVSNAGSGR
jgi:threonine dehydrogenase-like Zn-dependent dehydrogenase